MKLAISLFVSTFALVGVFFSSVYTQISPANIAKRSTESTVQIRALDESGRVIQSGTGFVISTSGLIVTNFHVVRGSTSLQTELSSGEIFDNIFYVTSDPRRDIVILRIFAEGLKPLVLGSDAEAEIGERVYVMGNPLGQTNTFSDGIVSAKRTIEGVSLLQITAPISPGSSGGPVMNSRGEVIGIATMGVRGGQNLNYAVPSRYIRPLLSTGESAKRFTASVLPVVRSGGLIDEPPIQSSSPARPPGQGQGSGRSNASPGEDEWENQVNGQLERADIYFQAEGLTRSHNFGKGELNFRDSDSFSLQLDARKRYAFVAVCDNDCSDIDLALYDASGRELKRDFGTDDFPIIVFQPPRTGRYSVKVIMAGCSVNPCRFGVSVYSSR